jgi:hypothetical protein
LGATAWHRCAPGFSADSRAGFEPQSKRDGTAASWDDELHGTVELAVRTLSADDLSTTTIAALFKAACGFSAILRKNGYKSLSSNGKKLSRFLKYYSSNIINRLMQIPGMNPAESARLRTIMHVDAC